MDTSPYAGADEEKLSYILTLAESRLAAQLAIGIAADQRGMTMASFLASIAAAVLAAWVSIRPPHAEALIVLVAGFGIASALAAASARPVQWNIMGNEPSNWLADIAEDDTLHNGRAAMAGFYDEFIEANNAALRRAAGLLRSAFAVMIGTLAVAGVVLLLTR